MAFKLEITKTGNAAFRDPDAGDCQRREGDDLQKCIDAANEDACRMECARILKAVAKEMENGSDGGLCMDANGNRVGEWSL